MDSKEIAKITEQLKEQYPDVGIRSIEVNPENGSSTFYTFRQECKLLN